MLSSPPSDLGPSYANDASLVTVSELVVNPGLEKNLFSVYKVAPLINFSLNMSLKNQISSLNPLVKPYRRFPT